MDAAKTRAARLERAFHRSCIKIRVEASVTKQSNTLVLVGSSLYAALLTLTLCTIFGSALALDRAHTLNIYAWSDYFPKSLIDQFQITSGIHVNLALFGLARNG